MNEVSLELLLLYVYSSIHILHVASSSKTSDHCDMTQIVFYINFVFTFCNLEIYIRTLLIGTFQSEVDAIRIMHFIFIKSYKHCTVESIKIIFEWFYVSIRGQ